MKGLVIWAHSCCRSTMALYQAIQKQAEFPVRIVVASAQTGGGLLVREARSKVGFRDNEFADVQYTVLNGDFGLGIKIMDECRGYAHLFCAYQMEPTYRRLIHEAHGRGERVFVGCEAPCNMSWGWRGVLKNLYLRFILRMKIRGVVRIAEKFICFSGRNDRLAVLAGWPAEKIVSFGYYPPPIEGSHRVERVSNSPFVILLTGVLARFRGADIAVRALKVLKDRGVAYNAIITQEGELLDSLKEYASRFDLPIEFAGFLSMNELIHLYETCSVYVGAGRCEPWGMRLNDALNCGAPLIVSREMGGVKFVDDYGCGLSYVNNDAIDLADKLQRLAEDIKLYRKVAKSAMLAAADIQPEVQAKVILRICAQ